MLNFSKKHNDEMREILRSYYEYDGGDVELVDELSEVEVVEECLELYECGAMDEFYKELEPYFEEYEH